MLQSDPNSALVVLSGGQDSVTCLFWALQHYDKVHAVTFNYGQKHIREIEAAKAAVALAGHNVLSHEIVDVGPILAGTSPLTNRAEVLEQYADHTVLPGGLEKTFVPGRNILFLTLAANRAYCLGAGVLITGLCQEDFGGYPDCRQMFVGMMQSALQEGLDMDLSIVTPLMDLTKAESVLLAKDIPGAWDALAFSHTAYDGAYPPVGHDHATLLRQKGFIEAGLPDPLTVRAFDEGVMSLPVTHNYDSIRNANRDHIVTRLRNLDKLKTIISPQDEFKFGGMTFTGRINAPFTSAPGQGQGPVDDK